MSQLFLKLAVGACEGHYGYEVDQESNLGEGGQGSVYKASKDGKEYAIKIAKPKSQDHLDLARKLLEREMQLHCFLTRYQHPNLVGFVQACRIQHDDTEIDGWPVIVMEYVKPWEIQDGNRKICTLQDYLVDRCRNGEQIPLVDVENIFRQVVRGVLYMHGMFVCNRDIKPDNILVTKDEDNDGNAAFPMRVKLCDFGLAKHSGAHSTPNSDVGTRIYMAPEILECGADRNKKYDGRKADVWCCGIVLYNLVALAHPFETTPWANKAAWAYARLEQLKHAPRDLVRPDMIIDAEWDSCWELITRMLQANPQERMPIEDVASHPFVVAPEERGKWEAENENFLRIGSEAAKAALPEDQRQQLSNSVRAQQAIAYAQDQWRLGAEAFRNAPECQVAALPHDRESIQSLVAMETDETQAETQHSPAAAVDKETDETQLSPEAIEAFDSMVETDVTMGATDTEPETQPSPAAVEALNAMMETVTVSATE